MRNRLLRRAPWLVHAALVGTTACTLYVRGPLPPAGAVFVVREPPPPRREVIPVRPGAGYVWIGGYWIWRPPEYVWVPGRWVLPPPGHRKWVAGKWYREPRGWFWVEGYWR